jgi:hypothetical protein
MKRVAHGSDYGQDKNDGKHAAAQVKCETCISLGLNCHTFVIINHDRWGMQAVCH